MKLFLAPILMMLVLSQTFSKWLVVLEYNMNKDFIAQNLCVNKVQPKLHCNGKCQMMKRLAEEEKQNSSNTSNNTSKIKVPELVYCNETDQPAIPLLSPALSSYNDEPPVYLHNVPSSPIFHPPALG